MNGEMIDEKIEPLEWITDRDLPTPLLKNRLVINGRLLTHNTRGGSLKYENGSLITR